VSTLILVCPNPLHEVRAGVIGPLLICALLCTIALVITYLGLKKFKQRRALSGCSRLLAGAATLVIALSLGAAGASIHTYQRLSYEQDLAEISFRKLEEQQFEVSLSLESTDVTRHFQLAGDEWQLDARVIKFHGLANLIGFNAVYRLERLSGRYWDIADELSAQRTVHSLAKSPTKLDLWTLALRYPIPGVDALYGSATYLPMRDGAQFRVRLTQSGLVARPSNLAGKSAVDDWKESLQ
tara:strand:+ start:77 stop:796 length:720 start_codon:yes stop_codon:yes gene_type:complete